MEAVKSDQFEDKELPNTLNVRCERGEMESWVI